MSFLIQNYKNERFPSFNQPEVVGYFSLNGQGREYSQDLSQLKYCNIVSDKTEVNFDLNKGLNQVIRKPADLDEKLDHILRWVINNYRKTKADPQKKRWLRPEFICFRGLLTKISTTPYEYRDGWIICAVKFHGSIYLCAFDTEEQKFKNANVSNENLQFMSWGFKFEQYVLKDSPDSDPDVRLPVNEAEEFCCLFSTKLGQNVLLYGAEMDGVCSEDIVSEPIDWKTVKFIELKTNKVIRNHGQREFYKKKLLKWWCQSFLVGTEDVLCGTRTENGKVFELENIKVSDMPKISKGYWDATNCMNFCNEFLNHVKTVVSKDYNDCIYKFEYKLGNKIEMEILPCSSKFSFLPEWYIEQVNKIVRTNM